MFLITADGFVTLPSAAVFMDLVSAQVALPVVNAGAHAAGIDLKFAVKWQPNGRLSVLHDGKLLVTEDS